MKPRSPAASTFSKDDGKDLKSIISNSKKSSVLAEENKNTGMHKQPLGPHELEREHSALSNKTGVFSY